MSWLEKIDEVHIKYFKSIFEQLGLKEYQAVDGNGMGGLRRFSNSELKAQLINDRGITTFEISSVHGPEEFIEFEIIMDDFSKINEPSLSPRKRGFGNKRYSFVEQVKFLQEHWNEILEAFSIQNYEETKSRIFK